MTISSQLSQVLKSENYLLCVESLVCVVANIGVFIFI